MCLVTQLRLLPVFLRAILQVNRLERAEQAAAEPNLSCGLINTLPASVAKAAATQNRMRETNCGVRVHFRGEKIASLNINKQRCISGRVKWMTSGFACAVPRRRPITESHLLMLEIKDRLPPSMTPFPAEALLCSGSPNEIFNPSSFPLPTLTMAPWRLLTQVWTSCARPRLLN